MVINVLVVEDNPLVRLGVRAMLEMCPDFRLVAEAADGLEALRKEEEYAPDLVLLDIDIPLLDGFEVAKKLKGKRQDLCIIAFSTMQRQSDVMRFLATGANGYCAKTASAKQLEMAFRSCLSGAIWVDSSSWGALRADLQRPQEKSQACVPGKYGDLSPRENDVVGLLVQGCSNKEIANRLCISPETVKTHMRHIMEKLSVSHRTQIAVKAARAGVC